MSNYTWIESLIASYSYNRDRQDIVNMIEGTINRILGSPYEGCNAGDDDTNILTGAIVCEFGDYGTSPRYGWIYEEHKEGVLEVLYELLEYNTTQLKLEKMED